MLDEKEFVKNLTRVFSDNGLSGLLSHEKSLLFSRLADRLITENEKYNLTAICEPNKIILHHFLDSAVLAPRVPAGAAVADIGCGAGFPSLPLAILRPDVRITAIDSTAKRVNYVNETARLLGLTNITAVAMRAEDGAKAPEYRERYDVVTARAVAELRVLSELTLGYARLGGKFIAMKGKNAEFELSAAKRAIAVMGGKLRGCEAITLVGDGEEISHPLIIIDKKTKTPEGYPRPYAKISKKPL